MSDSEPRRRRRKPKSLSERVPYNVVIDILSRLLVKSLIRFRHVSKSWYSLNTDPFFINKHFNLNLNKAKSLYNNNGYLQYTDYDDDTGSCWKELRTVVCNSDHTATEISRLKIPFYRVNVISLCNGIFFLECYDNRHVNTILYLWNPGIRKFKKLSVPYNNYHYAYTFCLSFPKQ
nr:putative F-box protein At1g47730 [Quercus suber]